VSQARGGTLPETFVVALREIRVGEELLIDYAWDADLMERCFCGEDACRGWIVSQLEADRLRTIRDPRRRSRPVRSQNLIRRSSMGPSRVRPS
jgi:hypothetical protein